jgi:hypothetical protein
VNIVSNGPIGNAFEHVLPVWVGPVHRLESALLNLMDVVDALSGFECLVFPGRDGGLTAMSDYQLLSANVSLCSFKDIGKTYLCPLKAWPA